MKKRVYILDEVSSPLKDFLDNKYETILFIPEVGWDGDVTKRIESLHMLLHEYNNHDVIYVASSMGVFTILPFSYKYPGIINRVVLLDPSHTEWGPAYLNIIDSHNMPKSNELEQFRSLFKRSNEASISGALEMERVDTLKDLDLLVIAAGSDSYAEFLPHIIQEELMTVRHKLLKTYSQLTTNGKFIVLEEAEHSIAMDKTEEVIALIQNSFIECLY